MQERQKACKCSIPAGAWLAFEGCTVAAQITNVAMHTRRICRVGFDRTWHINWGITRWNDEPLKDKGFPERPVPFSPTHQALVAARGNLHVDQGTRAEAI